MNTFWTRLDLEKDPMHSQLSINWCQQGCLSLLLILTLVWLRMSSSRHTWVGQIYDLMYGIPSYVTVYCYVSFFVQISTNYCVESGAWIYVYIHSSNWGILQREKDMLCSEKISGVTHDMNLLTAGCQSQFCFQCEKQERSSRFRHLAQMW